MRFYRKKELISYLKEMKCKQQKLLLLQKNYQEILFDLQECAIIIGYNRFKNNCQNIRRLLRNHISDKFAKCTSYNTKIC